MTWFRSVHAAIVDSTGEGLPFPRSPEGADDSMDSTDLPAPTDLTSASPNERIYAYQHELAKLPQIDLEAIPLFLPGIYIRTVVLPKGSSWTGKKHLYAHASFVDGDVTVVAIDGEKRITGAHFFVSPAGTKRALYVHETTVWKTIHANPTEERDPEKLLDLFVVPETMEEVLAYKPKELQ